MERYDLNLSTQPIPAYRLANLALLVGLAVLLLIAVWQVSGFLRYARLADDIRGAERDLQVESEVLAGQLRELHAVLDRPESAAKLSEIEFLNGVILRKSFSWTRMFARLEEIMPDDVHLTSLQPQIFEDGSTQLRLQLKGRSIDDVSALIESMESSPAFEGVQVSVEQKTASAGVSREVDIQLAVQYFPERELP